MDMDTWEVMCEYADGAFRGLMAELLTHSYVRAEGQPGVDSPAFTVEVGLTGRHKGRIAVTADAAAARALTRDMNFGQELASHEEQSLYLAEFTNMLAGKIITGLNNVYGTGFRLTPPGLVCGSDENRLATSLQSHQLTYSDGGAWVVVDLFMAAV